MMSNAFDGLNFEDRQVKCTSKKMPLHSAKLAMWKIENCLVQSQLSKLTDTETLMTALSPPRSHPGKTILFRKQGVPTYRSIVFVIFKILSTTVLVGLMLLLLILLYRHIFLRRPGESQLQVPVEKTNRTKQSGKCVVPANPEYGINIIPNAPAAKPGDSFESLKLIVKCLPDYGVLETEMVFCINGVWSHSIPKCIRFCKLDNNPSVHYHCLVTGFIEGRRTCNAYEPSGTVVKPECNNSPKNSVVTPPLMTCINGSWDNVAVCSPASECGRVTSNDVDLMNRDEPAKRIELPWHVGIYRKTSKRHMHICGGSLIANGFVISAAHCFWDDVIKQLPASRFAMAAGKIYHGWNNHRDVHAQKSDIKEIKISAYFHGSVTNFQGDIAVLILETPFEYTPFVRPVCLDFDVNFETRQLQPEKMGKVAGWGPTAEHGKASQALQVVELPYLGIEQCIEAMTRDARVYLTGDKICAGNGNGTALCRGDSGGGLVFPESERGADRYYLRGIVSTAPMNDKFCNSYSVTTFTQILYHAHFIMQFLSE